MRPIQSPAGLAAAERLESDREAAPKQWRLGVERASYERLYTRAVPTLISALSEFGVTESLAVEIRNRVTDYPAALSASREIDRLITIARQTTGVRGNFALCCARCVFRRARNRLLGLFPPR